MMPRFCVVAPAITPDALFGDDRAKADAHGYRAGYSEARLRRAITDGVDPSRKPLDWAMPRWSMGDQGPSSWSNICKTSRLHRIHIRPGRVAFVTITVTVG